MSTSFHFLHFCDFHIGGPRGPQAIFLDSLVGQVKKVCAQKGDKISAVFLTGDLAHGGGEQEYETFAKNFFEPLMKITEVQGATVFAVPGNHDVACDECLPITWDSIQGRNQPIFFCEDLDGRKARKMRAYTFAGYINFINKYSIISPNPKEEVSKFFSFEDGSMDLILTNTAFFSDKSEDSSLPTTPPPLPSLMHHVKSGPRQRPLLVVGHHSINTFIPTAAKQFESFLWEKKAVYFHGHEHLPKPITNASGTLRALGFGASYVAGMDKSGSTDYVNSFVRGQFGENLKINCYTWQGYPGVWADTTSIYFHDCLIKDTGSDVAILRLPLLDGAATTENIPLSQAPRSGAKPLSIIPLGDADDHVWTRLFITSENLQTIFNKDTRPKLVRLPEVDGKRLLAVEGEDGRHLIIIERGVNHVLSLKEIESFNTRLDSEDFKSVTILSFGKIADDARIMYVRLRARKKRLEVLTNKDFTEASSNVLTAAQTELLFSLDGSTNSVNILVGENDVYLLVVTSDTLTKTFQLIRSDGASLLPSDPVVTGLRAANPEFERLDYQGARSLAPQMVTMFDEQGYKKVCHRECNTIRYAALASAGFQLSDHTLEELYVSGTASEVAGNKSGRLNELVDDYLAAYSISDELKEHIQKQLLSSLSETDRSKASGAREFCQKFPAVLLTGDPGSGKTCFVKNEILAYCRPRTQTSTEGSIADWHAAHIPVLVQLSELAVESDLRTERVYDLASKLLSRRGLDFPAKAIQDCEKQGRIAWFFDGLDEVVSVEKRALVVQVINDLVEGAIQSGNRVVVTSRPAAVHVVNLLPSLKKLELQGLSESEITMLAGRVLRIKLTTEDDQLVLADGSSDVKAASLIRKLLLDCQQKPGVARLAQNPLLLTLLIMIYANSGAPSAKRHIIYERAVETLAAVRGREAGHMPISTQDLRERLGAVALSVYRKESGILPTRQEVCDVIKCVMTRQRGVDVSIQDSRKFLQKVAESTGLVVVQNRFQQDEDHAVVTFMHHSFLEYFAAVGLGRDINNVNIAELVSLPRWHEILTLLAGIIGESGDIAPILKRVLSSSRDSSEVDAKLLLFAMDCALECDVPSETAQGLISEQIRACLEAGPARLDPWIRSEIGVRAAQLFSACGGTEFDRMLSDLIDNGAEDVCAAAIGVVAFCFASGYKSEELLEAYNRSCGRNDDNVLCAVCSAAAKTSELRSEVAIQVIGRSLTKSSKRRQAAFEALSNIPSLAGTHWSDVINGMDDPNKRTARLASIAAIQGGLNSDYLTLSGSRKDVLVKALHTFDETGTSDGQVIKVRKETVERMLTSIHSVDRLIGIQVLPLSDAKGQFVFDTLFEIIRAGKDHQEVCAAIYGLRLNADAAAIMKLDELRIITDLARTGTADIREAASRLLGNFGSSVDAIEALLSADYVRMHSDEYTVRLNSLSQAKVLNKQVDSFLFSELDRLSNENARKTDENIQRLRAVLSTIKRTKGTAPSNLISRIKNLAEDARIDAEINKAALLCYPAIAIPSQAVVLQICTWIKTLLHGRDFELVQVPSIFAARCKESVDYVSASIKGLVELRAELIVMHARISKRTQSDQTEFFASELRKGISEITEIVVTFKDLLDSPLKTLSPVPSGRKQT